MPLTELLKDTKVVSDKLVYPDRVFVTDYVARRVRTLSADPSLGDQTKDGDITAAAAPVVAAKLIAELPRVKATHELIAKRVVADVAVHLPLDATTLRKRGTKRPSSLAAPNPQAYRRWLVRTIVYQAVADDIKLLDAPELDRLHRLVDRRLRIVERMLYDVGRTGGYAFNMRQIGANPGAPWTDGYERIFEYPRVSGAAFGEVCNPDSNGHCRVPLQDWSIRSGGTFLVGPKRTNPRAAASWRPNPGDEYELDYDPDGGLDPATAVRRLFEPSPDYASRNLLFCDHTIHALHHEALFFAYAKRSSENHLNALVTVKGKGWLRLYNPFLAGSFLASPQDPLFFHSKAVRARDLQVGDHVIVYNHPAYAHTTVDGVWRLENAVVVQTVPNLLMQGHGSAVSDLGGMVAAMLRLFTGELAKRRKDVVGRASVRSFAANRVTVDTAKGFSPRMHVDIVSADAAETVLAADREITAINGTTITYGGASVTSSKSHRLRRARVKVFNGTREAIQGRGYRLMRRVAGEASQYDARNLHADWYVAWDADLNERGIAGIPSEAAFRKERQLVEYTHEPEGPVTKTIGWFPLWEPVKSGGAPVRSNGKISATQPVRVGQRHVAAWTRWFESDPKQRDRVAVIRPREG